MGFGNENGESHSATVGDGATEGDCNGDWNGTSSSCDGNCAMIGGSSGVVAVPSSYSLSCTALARSISIGSIGPSFGSPWTMLLVGVSGSCGSGRPACSPMEPASDGARVELARDKLRSVGLSSDLPGLLVFRLRHFCDNEGIRVPKRKVRLCKAESLARCLLSGEANLQSGSDRTSSARS